MTYNNKAKTVTYCGLLTAIMCIVAPFSIPVGVIPVTFGLAAVMLTGVVADLKTAVISTALYVALGAFGLPVFSGWRGSLAVILGPAGGYIWGYIPAVAVCSFLCKKNTPKRVYMACIAGSLVCYICGTLQYMFITGLGFYDAFRLCAAPFIVLDALKMLFVSAVGMKIKKRLNFTVKQRGEREMCK